MDDSLLAKLERLRGILRENAPVLIAYSGGVDSAYLLAEARRTLGAERMLGVIADSASLPRKALAEAMKLARQIDAPLEVVRTGEFENPDYLRNAPNRCYFCKAELFLELERMAARRGFAGLAYGENADDMRQVRPGREAAAQFAVLAPLRDAGLNKEEIRSLSRELGLPTADAPAQPCLSSRIPHGLPVTRDALAMVESGEEWVRSLGFSVFRVRHWEQEPGKPIARVEIAPPEMPLLEKAVTRLEEGLRAVGYIQVEIDPKGYRSA